MVMAHHKSSRVSILTKRKMSTQLLKISKPKCDCIRIIAPKIFLIHGKKPLKGFFKDCNFRVEQRSFSCAD